VKQEPWPARAENPRPSGRGEVKTHPDGPPESKKRKTRTTHSPGPGSRLASSRLLASIVDSSDDAIFSKTLDGIITTWNTAAERMYGYQAGEIIGQHVSLLAPRDRVNETTDILERIRNGERVHHYETTRRTKDGAAIAISLTVSPIHDSAGHIVGASAIARDITERERVQEQARSAAQYARSLIEASLDPLVVMVSPEGKITDVNEATIRVTGVARDELVGTDFSGYFTEPDAARAAYRQVFAQGLVTDYPLTIRHSGGAPTDVLYNGSVYKDAAGKVLGAFAAARDVTAQKRAIRELAEAKAFLDNLLQSSTKYSIIGKDLNRIILSWNEGARRNYGYTAEEIIGSDSSVLHTPEELASGAVDRLLTTAYRDGLAEGTFQRVRKDGSRFTASVVMTRRDDADGQPIGFLLMSNDISAKTRAEEQLRTASQYARSLLEATADPLMMISPEGKITDMNEATIRATGVTRDELVGTDFSDYFTEPDAARAGYRQVFAQGFVTAYPLTIRHTGGALTDVLYNATVYKDAAGNVRGVFAAARDVTAQKRAERELAIQRARELDRLAELERFQKLTVGRELRMIELKKEIEDLRASSGNT
jgi:PAS domain S-box-containing protein